MHVFAQKYVHPYVGLQTVGWRKNVHCLTPNNDTQTTIVTDNATTLSLDPNKPGTTAPLIIPSHRHCEHAYTCMCLDELLFELNYILLVLIHQSSD